MKVKFWFCILPLALFYGKNTYSQSVLEYSLKNPISGGYIKGNFYCDLNRESKTPLLSSGFSETGLRLETGDEKKISALADVRFTYGSVFNEQINQINLKEAYLSYTSSYITVTAGQQIIKWGRTDFTGSLSKLNPQNYVSRSPDREDMDLGNLLLSAKILPVSFFDIQAVLIPYYRPSVLIIDPVPLPEGVEIKQMKSLVTRENLSGYGIKSQLHLKGTDIGMIWFEGYDPMPGIKLDSFRLDLSGHLPLFYTSLAVKPYHTRVLGLEFETVAWRSGIRGEISYSFPHNDYSVYEYVPMPEFQLVLGTDFNFGNWRFLAEYAGKYIPDFTPSVVDPLIGTEPDYQKLAMLITQPGFDIYEFVKEQTGSFNRLFNYQTHCFSHLAAIRIENEAAYGKVIPSAFLMYNLTTRDMLLIPEIRFKPSDGMTFTLGTEIYSGRKGSLYRLINDFMESIYMALRIDF